MPGAPSPGSSTTRATSSTRSRSWSSPTTRCSTTARAGPIVAFDQDHLTDYQPPRLELSLMRDALGQPFLLLAGYEPDFAWDAFAETVLRFSTVLDVGDRDLGARHLDARAAHASDRHDGERQRARSSRPRIRCGVRTPRCPRRPAICSSTASPSRVPASPVSCCSSRTTSPTPSTRGPTIAAHGSRDDRHRPRLHRATSCARRTASTSPRSTSRWRATRSSAAWCAASRSATTPTWPG